MKIIATIILFITVLGLQAQTTTKFTPADLEKWQTLGDGKGMVASGQFFMEEVAGSVGFMVLSPEIYADAVLRFEVMTLNPGTVLVALLNASDIGNSTALTIDKGNKGGFAYLTKEIEDYMFGFREMAHNTMPFIRKSPVSGSETGILGLAAEEPMHSGWRHSIECGRKGTKLWLKIDGKIIIDVTDNQPLQAGKIGIRVRGTGSELGKCLVRNVEIVGEVVI